MNSSTNGCEAELRKSVDAVQISCLILKMYFLSDFTRLHSRTEKLSVVKDPENERNCLFTASAKAKAL